MLLFIARRFSIFAILLAALTLVSCSEKDNEPKTRKAFIEFLQQNVLTRKAYYLPPLRDSDKKTFGRYVTHYQILVDFNQSYQASLNGLLEHRVLMNMKIQDTQSKWKEIVTFRAEIQKHLSAIDVLVQPMQIAKATLTQPDDLKVVYEQVFNKIVLGQTDLDKRHWLAFDNLLRGLEELGRFLDENKSDLKITDTDIEAIDPSLEEKLKILMDNIEKEALPMKKILTEMQEIASERPKSRK